MHRCPPRDAVPGRHRAVWGRPQTSLYRGRDTDFFKKFVQRYGHQMVLLCDVFSPTVFKVFTPNDAFIPCFLKRSESNNFLCDQIEEQVPIQVCKTIDKQRTPIVIGKGRWLETWSLKSIRFLAEHTVAKNHLTWNQLDQRKKKVGAWDEKDL